MSNSPTLLPITRHNLLAEALDAGLSEKDAHAISYNLYDAEFALERWTLCFNECGNMHDYLVVYYQHRYQVTFGFALAVHAFTKAENMLEGEQQP